MVFILNEQSAWLYPCILTDSLKMDHPFQIARVQNWHSNSCLRLRPRSVLGSFGVVLLSCKVNFHVVRSALHNPMCLASVQPSPPLRKNRTRGVCRGGFDCTQASLSPANNPFLALVWKRPRTKFPFPVFLMIAKDCKERLSAVALSVGLIIPRG